MDMDCSLCDKSFANQKCLLKHRRNIHNIFCIGRDRKKDVETNTYDCKYCNKQYNIISSRWRHEKTCKKQEDTPQETPQEKLENTLILKEEYEKLKLENACLKEKLIKSNKPNPNSIRSFNKILTKRREQYIQDSINTQNIQNSNNTINGNNNNNNINNYFNGPFISLGKEEIPTMLTLKQKIDVLDSRLCSIDKLIEITHCGNIHKFKNIIITNLKDNFAYKYDDQKGAFVTVNKNDLLEDVINYRLSDIEAIYHELKDATCIDPKTKDRIRDFLEKMNDTEKAFYDNETKYENFKTYKTNIVKILLYNNQDKITKDIALLLS
jgi:hypothetical protein